jgi:hypothetical protein
VIGAAYDAGLDEIFALLPAGPPPRRRARPRWSEAQRKAWNLATRLRVGADQFLACLDDTRVAWDNNVAESPQDGKNPRLMDGPRLCPANGWWSVSDLEGRDGVGGEGSIIRWE